MAAEQAGMKPKARGCLSTRVLPHTPITTTAESP
jgi:hypothetical protein